MHRKADDALARDVARDLRARGIDCWYDGWEILGGQNFVLQMETGLRNADGGLVLLTPAGIGEGSWSAEEFAALLRRVVESGEGEPRRFVIPVVEGVCPDMPEFLKTRQPIAAQDREKLAEHILRYTGHLGPAAPALGELRLRPPHARWVLELAREGDDLVARFEGLTSRVALVPDTLEELSASLRPVGVLRDAALRAARASEQLAELGRRLGALLSDGEVTNELAARLKPEGRASEVALVLRSDDEEVLALPWEATRLPGLPAFGILPRVSLAREAGAAPDTPLPEIPGPLKVLVAVAAPEHDLDQEHESQVILDALEGLQQVGTRVVFADESAATLDALRSHLDQEPFHVLHLSCHGRAGGLRLEDAEGAPADVSADKLVSLLANEVRHCPQLVVLSACKSGATADEPAGLRPALARALLAAGVPAVVAMQGPVGDGYATELARHFYGELARGAEPVPALALAEARRRVERDRLEHAERGLAFRAREPEYATPAAWTAPMAALSALYDGTRPVDPQPSSAPLAGVPGLAMRPLGYFVGRRDLRRELRRRVVTKGAHGAVLWGMGGSGKSSLACSLAERLRREGWLVAVVVGDVTLTRLVEVVVRSFDEQARGKLLLSAEGAVRINRLRKEADSKAQLGELRALLAAEPVLLLLDNFETNFQAEPGHLARRLPQELGPDGKMPRLNAALAGFLPDLASAAHTGALLLTSRYRVEELEDLLPSMPGLGPLRPVELRRFLWRLPGVHGLDDTARSELLEELGGHPRVLEFADALLREEQDAPGSPLAEVRGRIQKLAAELDLDLSEDTGTSEERTALARRLAAEDVLLDELLGCLTDDERTFMVAASVFRRGVPLQAMLKVATAAQLKWDVVRMRRAIRRLTSLTLLAPMGTLVRPGAVPPVHQHTWAVHRWTAASLAERAAVLPEAHATAASWWLDAAVLPWEDAWEALEHLIDAGHFDRAHQLAVQMCSWSRGSGHTADALALIDRMAQAMPGTDWRRFGWLGESVEELLSLGRSADALQRAQEARAYMEDATATSKSPDLLRRLSVSNDKLADLHRAQGNVREARRLYEEGLAISLRLAEGEPDSSEFQRDLSVSYAKLASLHVALGNGLDARRFFEEGLAISQRLAEGEPDRTQFQRDLSVFYSDLARLHKALGNGTDARHFCELDVAIAQRLAEREPNRADFQRDLRVSYNNLADLHRDQGNVHEARRLYDQGLAIAQSLAGREPDRADFQRDLALCFERMALVTTAAESLEWIDRAIATRRSVVHLDAGHAVAQRELGIALLQRGRLSKGASDVIEAAQILVALWRRGALEAQYIRLAEQLAQVVDSGDTGLGPTT